MADGEPVPTPRLGELLEFRTADDGPFTFLHFGDSGTGDDRQAQVARRMAGERAALVLANGDLAYPLATYEAVDRLYFSRYEGQMARVPFFAVLGNHDCGVDNGVPLLSALAAPGAGQAEGRYYSFDWGNVHFVALDSNGLLT